MDEQVVGPKRSFAEDFLTGYSAFSSSHATQLIMQWLHEHDYKEALKALEADSGVTFSAEGLQRSGQLMRILTEHHELQLAMQQDGGGARNQHLEDLLHGGNGKFVNTLHASMDHIHPTKPILAVAFSPDPGHTWMATGSADKTIRITDYHEQTPVLTLEHHQAGVLSLAFSPATPNMLLSGSMDGSAAVHNLSTSSVQSLKDHKKYVVAVAWHPNGHYLATGSYDHTVCLYEKRPSSDTFELKQQYIYPSNVESVHFTADGKLLLIAVREDNYLHCINMDTLTEWKFNMNANHDDHISFSALHLSTDPDSKYVAVATDKDRAIMFSLADQQQVRNFWGSSNDLFSQPRVAFDLSTKYIYCTAQDQKLHVYDISSEKLVHKNSGHTATIRDMHHHPTENIVATASFDRTIKLWSHQPTEIGHPQQ